MKKLIVSIFLILPFCCFGQFSESIVSDRPGQSMSPMTVGKKAVQFQVGYSHESLNLADPILGLSEYTDNNANAKIRWGLLERTEISGQITGGESAESNMRGDYVQSGVQLIGVGVRQNIIAPGKGGVRLGAELESRWQRSGDELMYSDLLLTISGGLELGDRFSATANSGFGIETKELFFTANLGFSVSEKIGVFAEYYPVLGNYQDDSGKSFGLKRSYVQGGGYFVADPSFILDFMAGYMVPGDQFNFWNSADGFVVQVGFTARLDWRE